MQEHLLYLDGGMGTLLQEAGLAPGEYPERWNLAHPEIIQKIQKSYFEAGSHVVATNTFGANALKFTHEELAELRSQNISRWISVPAASCLSLTAILPLRTQSAYSRRLCASARQTELISSISKP